MRLAQTEVYEVATFYHHFDVVKEGDAAPPALTVRVCDGLSCEMAGAQDLLARLPALLGTRRARDRGAVHRPLRAGAGRGRRPEPGAQRHRRRGRRRGRGRSRRTHEPEGFIDLAAYKAAGRLRAAAASASPASATSTTSSRRWRTRACAASAARAFRPAASGASCAAKPAPRLMAVNIDEGEPGTFKDRVYLERDPHRFLEGMLIAAWAVGIAKIYVYLRDEYHGCRALLEAELAKLRAAPPYPGMPEIDPAPRRRRLHLRRRVGDDRIDRRQARHAAAAPAVRRAGRPVRPADARAQLRDAVLGARASSRRAASGSPRTAATAARACARSRSRAASASPGVKLAPAGITIQRADRRVLRRHAGRAHASTPTCRAAPRAASCRRRWPTSRSTSTRCSRTAASSARPRSSCCRTTTRAVDAARNLMRFFEHESCGQCTPCRVGTAKASALIEQPTWDLPLLADLSQVMRDASICGLGQAAPNPIDCVVKYFPHELEITHERHHAQRDRAQLDAPIVSFELERPRGRRRRAERDAHRDRRRAKASRSRTFATRPASTRSATAAPAWSRSTASACWRRRAAARRRRAWKSRPTASARVKSQKMVLELLLSDMPEARVHAPQRGRPVGARSSASASRASRRAQPVARRPVAPGHRRQPRRLHPVHALRARLPRRAGQRRHRPGLPRRRTRRSCSTWTTRWARPPASPAASACRPARPAR